MDIFWPSGQVTREVAQLCVVVVPTIGSPTTSFECGKERIKMSKDKLDSNLPLPVTQMRAPKLMNESS